jgi:nucleoside-diphosphate-sugar epimerase
VKGRRVLVTGAAGFIGSHLVEALAASGAEVRALLRYSSDGRTGNLRELAAETLASVELVRGDLLDDELVGRVVAGRDTVFHLGALIAIPHSWATADRSWASASDRPHRSRDT